MVNLPIDVRFKEPAIEPPTPPMPEANYVGAVHIGNVSFLGGHTPELNGQPLVRPVGALPPR